MHINMYGKPYKNTYDYAEKIGRQLMERNNCENFEYEISRFYMIGDNPEVDIKGANM